MYWLFTAARSFCKERWFVTHTGEAQRAVLCAILWIKEKRCAQVEVLDRRMWYALPTDEATEYVLQFMS